MLTPETQELKQDFKEEEKIVDKIECGNGILLSRNKNDSASKRTLKFGKLKLHLDKLSSLLAVQLIIELTTYSAYSRRLDEYLTSIKVNDKTITLKLGECDESLKWSISNTYTDRNILYFPCYLCCDEWYPAYSLGVSNTMPHAECVAKLSLPSKKYAEVYVIFYVELPDLLLKEKENIPNLLAARLSVVNELIGKMFDCVTRGNCISRRRKLFGVGNSQDPDTFDWSQLRLTGQSMFDWDDWTTKTGMLYLHIKHMLFCEFVLC